MGAFTVTRSLDASPAEVWSVLADFGNIAEWNPNLSASRLLGEQAGGVGTTRQCDLKDGKNYVRERVTTWEDGRRMEIDIYEGTMPLKSAIATIVLEPAGPRRTKVIASMSFVPKGGAVRKVATEVFMKPMMKHMFGRLVRGLKEHVEAQGETAQVAATA